MAVVAGLIRARRNKTGPALPAARALPPRVVADLLCAARRIPKARRDRDAATYADVARTRAATQVVRETCSWLNPIPGRPLPAAVSVWAPVPGTMTWRPLRDIPRPASANCPNPRRCWDVARTRFGEFWRWSQQ
jgi:hypothetical protein